MRTISSSPIPIASTWSGNNYYTAHMRNLALMSMALDEADHPGGTLRAHLESATGSAALYVVDLRSSIGAPRRSRGRGLRVRSAGARLRRADAPRAPHRRPRLAEEVWQADEDHLQPALDNAVSAFSLHSLAGSRGLADPTYMYLGPLYSVGGDDGASWVPTTSGCSVRSASTISGLNNGARLAKLRMDSDERAAGWRSEDGHPHGGAHFSLSRSLYFMLFDRTIRN